MSDAPEIVRVTDVSKRFVVRRDNSLKERLVTFGRAGRQHREEFWALNHVDISITAGTTVGLIGPNGSGKSTLLKVIGGIIDPTTGAVSSRGRIAALLELGAGFHPDLTGRENVYLNASILGLSRAETDAQLDDILAFAGIGEFIDTQVKFYSSGMYVRLAFAVAVHTDPDLLLVDEVLAVGDEAFQRKCLDKIRAFQQEGRTIILVTHSLDLVVEMCDRAILLNQGTVVHDGDTREAVSHFRDILEDRRRGEAVAAHVEPEKAGRVLGARVEAVGRGPEDPVQVGDDLRVVVQFAYEGNMQNWICALQFDNAMGQTVIGVSTERADFPLAPLIGRRTVELMLKNTAFGAGKYFVNVSLMDFSGQHVDDMPQACSFNAVGDPRTNGNIHFEPVFVDHGDAVLSE